MHSVLSVWLFLTDSISKEDLLRHLNDNFAKTLPVEMAVHEDSPSLENWQIEKMDVLCMSSDKQSVPRDTCNLAAFVLAAENSLHVSIGYGTDVKLPFVQFLYCQNL